MADAGASTAAAAIGGAAGAPIGAAAAGEPARGGRLLKAATLVACLVCAFALGLLVRVQPAGARSSVATSAAAGAGGRVPPPSSALSAAPALASVRTRPLLRHGSDVLMAGMLDNLLAGPGGEEQFRFVYVDTPYAMTYCSINKVASSAWRRVMYLLAHPREPLDTPPSAALDVKVHTWFRREVEALTPAQKVAAIMSAAFTPSVVVREPVDRFMSGFLNKCVQEATTPTERRMRRCPVPRRDTPAATLDALLDALTVAADRHRTVDTHFLPQHTFCGLRLLVNYFNIIHFDDMLAGGMALLDAAPLAPEPRQRMAAAITAAVGGGKSNPTTELKDLVAALLTRTRLRRIVRLYVEDYRLFGFPLPPAFKSDAADAGGL